MLIHFVAVALSNADNSMVLVPADRRVDRRNLFPLKTRVFVGLNRGTAYSRVHTFAHTQQQIVGTQQSHDFPRPPGYVPLIPSAGIVVSSVLASMSGQNGRGEKWKEAIQEQQMVMAKPFTSWSDIAAAFVGWMVGSCLLGSGTDQIVLPKLFDALSPYSM